ncbi:MAG: TolC family protein [Gemmatimonadota bacterium]
MKFLRLALLALPIAARAQGVTEGDARPLSLDEAIRLAERNSPATVQARSQIRTSEAAIRTAFGTWLPTLSTNYGTNWQEGERFFEGRVVPGTSPPWSYSYGISSSLEIFDGMRRANQMGSARANLASAEANERLQKYRIALEVKQQFFVVAAARESRSAAEAQLAQAEEQLKASSARVAAGAAILSDSLRSVIQVGNARLAVLTADNNLRNANATLTRLVATPFVVTAAVDANETVAPVSLDSAEVMRAIDDAPSVSQARSALSASSASVRQARAPYWPTLSMSGSYSGSRNDNSLNFSGGPFLNSQAVRISLNYPIFNGFSREENVARASGNEANAHANLRDARFAAEQQFAQFLGALRLAEARVAIQVASVSAAEEDLRVQNQRYALGSATQLDVLTSQLTLNQARSSLIQARYDARTAKAQIEALIGRELP